MCAEGRVLGRRGECVLHVRELYQNFEHIASLASQGACSDKGQCNGPEVATKNILLMHM